MATDITDMTPVKLFLSKDQSSVYDNDGHFVGLLQGTCENLAKSDGPLPSPIINEGGSTLKDELADLIERMIDDTCKKILRSL